MVEGTVVVQRGKREIKQRDKKKLWGMRGIYLFCESLSTSAFKECTVCQLYLSKGGKENSLIYFFHSSWHKILTSNITLKMHM